MFLLRAPAPLREEITGAQAMLSPPTASTLSAMPERSSSTAVVTASPPEAQAVFRVKLGP